MIYANAQGEPSKVRWQNSGIALGISASELFPDVEVNATVTSRQ